MLKPKYVAGLVLLVVVIITGTVVRSPNKQASKLQVTNGYYVALGDSVAAGIGLKEYSDSSACDRTEQAYPKLVAPRLNYKLKSVACSGATTEMGLLGSQNVNELAVTPQLSALLSGDKPQLVTITLGANDTEWTSLIQKCYAELCGSSADTEAVQAAVSSVAANLEQAFMQIKNKYPSGTPPVIITGYYKLFSPEPAVGCTELSGIEPTELNWITQLQDTIDTALQTATVNYNFVTYIPISFSGHELCTDNPWIQSLNAKKPYHPTEAGQVAIANQIVAALEKKKDPK